MDAPAFHWTLVKYGLELTCKREFTYEVSQGLRTIVWFCPSNRDVKSGQDYLGIFRDIRAYDSSLKFVNWFTFLHPLNEKFQYEQAFTYKLNFT